MKPIKNGSIFIVTSTNVMHCLDGKYDTCSCLANLKKDYDKLTLKQANERLLNDPSVRKCELCLEIYDIEIE